jgi:hypothetical protein
MVQRILLNHRTQEATDHGAVDRTHRTAHLGASADPQQDATQPAPFSLGPQPSGRSKP